MDQFLRPAYRTGFLEIWLSPCQISLSLSPSPFQAVFPSGRGGSPSLLTCPGFEDPCEREPKAGHTPLFKGALVALSRRFKSLVSGCFYVNQGIQPLSSSKFPTTLFFPNLSLYFQINKFFLTDSIPASNSLDPPGLDPAQLSY